MVTLFLNNTGTITATEDGAAVPVGCKTDTAGGWLYSIETADLLVTTALSAFPVVPISKLIFDPSNSTPLIKRVELWL